MEGSLKYAETSIKYVKKGKRSEIRETICAYGETEELALRGLSEIIDKFREGLEGDIYTGRGKIYRDVYVPSKVRVYDVEEGQDIRNATRRHGIFRHVEYNYWYLVGQGRI